TRLRGQFTSKGRPIIGSKGIGFLAVARYCSKMEIVSTTTRAHTATVEYTPKKSQIDLARYFEVPVPKRLLAERLSVISINVISDNGKKSLPKKYYKVNAEGIIQLRGNSDRWLGKKLQINYNFDCSSLEFRATIDFDYLLSLENQRDLEEISDFCTIDIYSLKESQERIKKSCTRITVQGLKDFVVRELSVPRKQGYVRNID